MFSCSDDALDSERIVGDWKMISIEANNCDDANIDLARAEIDENNCIVIDPRFNRTWCEFVLTISSDGTGVANYNDRDGYSESMDITYTVNDDTGEILLCTTLACGDAELVGDNLVWLVDNPSNGCMVVNEFTM